MTMNVYIIASIYFVYYHSMVAANENAKRLYDDLMTNYNRIKRPVQKPNEKLTVKLKLRLAQIVDVVEKEQIMISSIWLQHEWYDYKLQWDPVTYHNTTVLYVPSDMVWTPDLVLYNSVDETKMIMEGSATKATLHYNGKVEWEPPALVRTICPIKVQWFPFDIQSCEYKFGSWSYPIELIDLEHLENAQLIPEVNPLTGHTQLISTVTYGIDLSDYYPSVEWEILDVPAKRHVTPYRNRFVPGSTSSGYVDITFTVTLRRLPLFYMVNVVLPCVALLLLTILDFYLPSECGEKIALSISILICLTVFFLLLTESFPANSDSTPLIAQYLIFTFIMVTMAVVMTIFVLNLFFRSPSTHRMPKWVKKVFINFLPKYLLMQPPLTGDDESFRRVSSKSRVGSVINQPNNDTAASSDPKNPSSRHASFKKPQQARNFLALPGNSGVVDIKQKMEQVITSPQAMKAFENVCYIAEVLKQKDKDDKIDEDWKFVAMVVDRLFLFTFAVVSIMGTLVILLQAPTIYDNKPAIDPVNIKVR